MTQTYLPSSFRDPSGRLFYRGESLYRAVNASYQADYARAKDSGLFRELHSRNLLVRHEELPASDGFDSGESCRLVLKPEFIPFISYPYEWCYSQLRDAALATLQIQKLALDHGMTLKDASAYNIQFHRGKPVLIDTLSFETRDDDAPWAAYQQFCRHFLAPLLLMHYVDPRMNQLARVHIDGIPLELASSLLPARTKLNFAIQMHVHLHAKLLIKHSATKLNESKRNSQQRISKTGMIGLIDSLESLVRKLTYSMRSSEWSDYYSDTNYTEKGLQHKAELVERFIDRKQPGCVWDIGANNGFFSRIAARHANLVVAIDGDHEAVEYNYRRCRDEQNEKILPLVVDLSNPSGAIGWHHRERSAFLERGPADVALALALMHHLCISNNVPFDLLARFMAEATRSLIIEFVPKDDSQVQRLLQGRADVFDDYSREAFEAAFSSSFQIVEAEPIVDSKRVLYLMDRIQ